MDQVLKIQDEERLCVQLIETSVNIPGHCPKMWDGAFCWPSVPPGSSHSVPCPAYIHGFDTTAHAFKFCNPDGTWWVNSATNMSWTNYSSCSRAYDVESPDMSDSLSIFNSSFMESHMSIIKDISQVGYTVSLVSLVAALLILACIRRLRCPRNNLHMQLFLSFMMRAIMFILKNYLFYGGVGLRSNVDFSSEGLPVFLKLGDNIDCKLFTSFWHYFLMANYSWILMEGLYLHNLVFLSMFTDTSGIYRYILMGWGLPLIFLIPWIIVRVFFEDTLCWTVNKNVGFFWIIRGPITLSIMINFVFFINITRVLFLKMFMSQALMARRYRYRKWFKSTLVLVPLFGVHYFLLLVVSLMANIDSLIEVIWLYIDQAFSSFQGFFVALLYCFLNGEVQAELSKAWLKCWPRDQKSHQSLFTQSLTYLSKGRSSMQSLHSATLDKKDTICRSASPSLSHVAPIEIKKSESPNTVNSLEPDLPRSIAGLQSTDSVFLETEDNCSLLVNHTRKLPGSSSQMSESRL